MTRFKIIGFSIVMTLMTIAMFMKIQNTDEREKAWEEALKTKTQETLNFDFTSYRDYTHCYRYHCSSGTSVFLNVKEFQGKKAFFQIDNDYSFLNKSEITLSYFNLLGKKCPLKIEAIFENKTYSLREWSSAAPLSGLDTFVQNDCY